MDQHVLDQWSISHAVWGFVLGYLSMAPKRIAAWKLGLLFVIWELWENVIEVAFSTYAPGQYHGDSLVISVFDMIPSMSGVWMGRHYPRAWPVFLLAEIVATRMGFGIHSIFLGHQGSICDLRVDPAGCGPAYVLRVFGMPIVSRWLEGCLWRAWDGPVVSAREESPSESPTSSKNASPMVTRRAANLETPEMKARRRITADGPSDFKL